MYRFVEEFSSYESFFLLLDSCYVSSQAEGQVTSVFAPRGGTWLEALLYFLYIILLFRIFKAFKTFRAFRASTL